MIKLDKIMLRLIKG